MFGMLRRNKDSDDIISSENDFSENGLRKALFSRIAAFEINGSKDFSYFQNREIWGVNLSNRPLYLLWNHDPKYYLTMRYFLAMYDVRGLVGGGLHIVPSTMDDFKRDAKQIQGLTAVIFGGEEGYEPICRQLGIPFTSWRFADQYAFPNQLPQMCAPYIRQNLNILDQLADEQSRITLLATMLYRLTLDPKWISTVIRSDSEMYFCPNVDAFKLTNDEVFIDGGGSLGDTVHGFKNLVNSFRHIYSFEPGPVGAGIMRRMFGNDEKITVYELGLASSAGSSGFSHEIVHHVGTVNGVISKDAGMRINLESLDNLNIGEVTFIKLDIEGFECEALRGARKTIEKYKPKLAICTYHKPEDFGEIFNLIKSIRDDYTIYLRHYSGGESDSVFYAV